MMQYTLNKIMLNDWNKSLSIVFAPYKIPEIVYVEKKSMSFKSDNTTVVMNRNYEVLNAFYLKN